MDTRKNKERLIGRKAYALLLVLGGGACLAIAMQGLLSFALPTQAGTSVNNNANEAKEEIRTAKIVNPFDGLSLEARAVYVLELKTGSVLFAKNANKKLPLASVTKIMTTFVARDQFSPNVVVTITRDDLMADGDSGLHSGERWRLGDILDVMLIASSNDAAHAIAGFVGANGYPDETHADIARANFVHMMNEKASELKLDQMQFFNESGLDVSFPHSSQLAQVSILEQGGGYGSARNVADLFAELWKKYPETIEITAHKNARIISSDEIAHILPNTNEIVGNIPGLVASKTGFTNISGGNLAVIFDRGIGDPIVVVVLGSSYKGRFDDMQKLVDATRK